MLTNFPKGTVEFHNGTLEIKRNVQTDFWWKELKAEFFNYFRVARKIILPADMAEIYNFLFLDCRNLIEITLPDGVRKIGVSAFKGCEKLEQIIIPERVTAIEDSAFAGCHSLKSVYLPRSLEEIGESAFEFTGLEDVILPNNLKKIKESSFEGCRKLEMVGLPEELEIIEERAFAGCSSLSYITMPYGLKHIDNEAFKECISLNGIAIPFGIKEINGEVFSGCKNLRQVEIQGTINHIFSDAFRGCKALECINLPEGLINIAPYAFAGCKSLQEIELPSTLLRIGRWAFAYCEGLKEIHIPENISDIEEEAFLMEKYDLKLYMSEITFANIKANIISSDIANINPEYFDANNWLSLDINGRDFKCDAESFNYWYNYPQEVRFTVLETYEAFKKVEDTDFKIEAAINYFDTDSRYGDYLSKIPVYVIDFARRYERIDAVEVLLEHKLISRKAVDKCLEYATEKELHEIYAMLVQYKQEIGGYDDKYKKGRFDL